MLLQPQYRLLPREVSALLLPKWGDVSASCSCLGMLEVTSIRWCDSCTCVPHVGSVFLRCFHTRIVTVAKGRRVEVSPLQTVFGVVDEVV